MRRETRTWSSDALGHDMELIVYGHAGQGVIAFPSQDGRAADWEGFGMIDSIAHLLEEGRLVLVSVDSVDWQSWTNQGVAPGDRARRHEDYHRYIVQEVVPFVRAESGRDGVWATGASMGAYHAANTFFRQPAALDGVIAMSGLYQPRLFVGDYVDDPVYFNSPLYFLPNLDDPWLLDRYRAVGGAGRLVFVCGQGAWEDDAIADHRALQGVLEARGIPASFDYWGHDVEHHWYWWQRMLPHYLERMGV